MSEEKRSGPGHLFAILHKWGIHTVGEFARLDKEAIAARLGPEAVRLWERANGKSTRVLKLARVPETFRETFEFEHEIETLEPLLFMLRRFLEQLSHRLGATYLVAAELTLGICFSSKQRYERCFKIPQPTNDVDLLFRMLHAHLEDFKSEHPITAVSLEAKPSKPVRQQFGLFETVLRNPARLSETLARLIGMLGADRVGTPVVEETHRSDAFRLEPFTWQVGAIEVNRPQPAQPISPALRRFRTKISASVMLEKNRPVHLRSTEMSGSASAQSGPYHASGDWWDEKTWSRIEWDLQLAEAALLRCHQSASGWQIDGVYD